MSLFPLAPPARVGNDAFTKLLLHCDGADASTTFADSSASAHTITANGNAQVDTAQSVFGGASYLGDGSGDFLSAPSSADFNLGGTGSGDFTIDLRIRYAADTSAYLISCYNNATSGWYLFYSAVAHQLRWGTGASETSVSWTPSTNTWYHIEVGRSGGTVTCYIDGTSIGTFTDIDTNNDSQALNVGGLSGVNSLNGHMDEVRISKEICRHTANFTPPVGPYS